jgi:hypothetical protein
MALVEPSNLGIEERSDKPRLDGLTRNVGVAISSPCHLRDAWQFVPPPPISSSHGP